MAIIFEDDFEDGTTDAWDTVDPNAIVVSTAGLDMAGNYCLDLTASNAYVRKDITATDERYFAFLWRQDSVATYASMLLFYNGSTYLASLWKHGVSNLLKVYRGTTVIDSGTQVLDASGTTYLIEVYFKLADSGGRWIVKIDGNIDIDFTGDTKNDTNTQFDKVKLGWYASAYHAHAYFDNFKIDDSGFPVGGWTGKLGGITNPAKINGVAVVNIANVMGIS